MSETKNSITNGVESELSRLDVHTTRSRPEGISVYADDDLPAGWVRVSDGTGEAFGLASEIAARLAEVPVTGEVADDGRDLDWEAAWDALGEFSGEAPVLDCFPHDGIARA